MFINTHFIISQKPFGLHIDAHVGFLHLLGTIIKRGGGVLHGCYCHYHIGSENCTVRAFEALRLYLKYSTHKHSVFKFIIYGCPGFSAEKASCLLHFAKIMQTSAMKTCFQIAECSKSFTFKGQR